MSYQLVVAGDASENSVTTPAPSGASEFPGPLKGALPAEHTAYQASIASGDGDNTAGLITCSFYLTKC